MNEQAKQMSRREFLRGAATISSLVLLAACGAAPNTAGPTAVPAATVAANATSPVPTAAAQGSVVVLQPGKFKSQIDTAGVKKGGTLVLAGGADTFNPILLAETVGIHSLIFDGMTYIDPDTLEAAPNLAESWQISPDNKTYTFKIKSGVKWHDGEPLTAEDIKFSYDLYMNPETGTAHAGTLKDYIASIEAPNATTIVMTLKDVIAAFLGIETSYGIVPKHLLEKIPPHDIPTSTFSTAQPVGTGAFKLKEHTPGESLTLEANLDYHRGAPALDRVVYKTVKDNTALYQQLKTGELDIGAIQPTFYGDAKSQTAFTTFVYDAFNFRFFGYNLNQQKGAPIFQDVKVRQALFYAVDRAGIVATAEQGLATVAQGTMPVLSWAYQPDKIAVRYDFDPAKAEQLLDAAGWAKGADGMRLKDGKKLSFTLDTYSGNKVIEGYMTVFQQNWKDIGVEMTPRFQEFGSLVERISKTYDFEAVLIGFHWDPEPDQRVMWDSKQYGQGFNLFNYANPKVDALLVDGLKTLDREKRKQIYLEMQNLILADAPALIIDFPKLLQGVNSRVKNYVPNPVDVTWNAYQWSVTGSK